MTNDNTEKLKTDLNEEAQERVTDDPQDYDRLSDEEVKKLVTEMFEEHRDRLLRMIEVRLQHELRARVTADDVLQESFVEAFRQLKTGVSRPKGSALVWLRLIVGQQLVAIYRRYCQTQKRNVAREISISGQRAQADMTSTSLFLVGNLTSPSVVAQQQELAIKVRQCLESLSEPDRDILSMRHFEQLTNKETAEELGVTPNAASVMYMRALKRFKDVLKREKIDRLFE